MLLLFAYDDVPKEIYEIEEVRKWVEKLTLRHPHVFYFLSSFMQNKQLIYACLANFMSVGSSPTKTTFEWTEEGVSFSNLPQKQVAIEVPEKIHEAIAKGVISYCTKIGETKENIMEVLKVDV